MYILYIYMYIFILSFTAARFVRLHYIDSANQFEEEKLPKIY